MLQLFVYMLNFNSFGKSSTTDINQIDAYYWVKGINGNFSDNKLILIQLSVMNNLTNVQMFINIGF